jgi:hypothetical protein
MLPTHHHLSFTDKWGYCLIITDIGGIARVGARAWLHAGVALVNGIDPPFVDVKFRGNSDGYNPRPGRVADDSFRMQN